MNQHFSLETKGFRIPYVNSQLDWKIESKSIYGLVGKNGCGKTTFLKSICGLIDHQNSVFWNHEKNDKLKFESLSLIQKFKLVHYVPHDLITQFPMSVYEVLTLGSEYGTDGRGLIEDLLNDDPLKKYLDQPFQVLSTGQRQLVIAWKALLSSAKVIFFDETFSMLDYEQKLRMAKVLRKFKTHGKSFVIVSHDWSWVKHVSEKIFHLDSSGISEIDQSFEDRNLISLEINRSAKTMDI